MKKISLKKIYIPVLFLFSVVFSGCHNVSSKYNTFTIWTDKKEFVSYSELFNSLHSDTKAVIIYKPKLANSLPPAKDEEQPDLIIGSWLKNSKTKKFFRPLDSLLSEDCVNTDSFYAPLIEYGRTSGRQYLLPVSFNLPLMIFSKKYEKLLPDQYQLSIQQIQDTSATFNKKNIKGVYTNMGFAPSWDEDFVYLVTKQFGPVFAEKGNSFVWDREKLDETVEYIKNWTSEKNESTTVEQDFEFKYLYTPKYRQIAQDRTLFAFTTSSSFFNISFEQLGDIDYRWISVKNGLPIEDDIVSLAIYKKTKKPKYAETFIKWFFTENAQKAMLERANKMHLDTSTFGVASGFSSIKAVNEHIFPTFYRSILGNLPTEQMLSAPISLPARWESLKERVIFPYLSSAIKTEPQGKEENLEELLSAWSKQFD